jgi:hypothetical protein
MYCIRLKAMESPRFSMGTFGQDRDLNQIQPNTRKRNLHSDVTPILSSNLKIFRLDPTFDRNVISFDHLGGLMEIACLVVSTSYWQAYSRPQEDYSPLPPPEVNYNFVRPVGIFNYLTQH